MSEDSLTVFTKSYCSSAHVREMIYLVADFRRRMFKRRR